MNELNQANELDQSDELNQSGEFDSTIDRRQRQAGVVETAAIAGTVDRRRHSRYPIDAWAEVMVKDATMLFRGRVLDVSIGGCYVETEARLRLSPGTPVEMIFRAGDRVVRCDATSRMVRTHGAGFLFAPMSARVRGQLEQLLAELSSDAGCV